MSQNIYHMTCEKDHIAISKIGKKAVKITTWNEYVAWAHNHLDAILMASSSMDFPDEYTKDVEIQKLCDKIRNQN